MRDRLLDLCREAQAKYLEEEPPVGDFGAYLADHLLAKGMIVPPCKVGDTVYRTYGNFRGEKIYEGFVDQIRVSKNGEMRFYVYGHPLGFSLDDVGKNVFLTREEAEQAMKGENHAEIH